MNARKLVFLLCLAPFTGLLVATRVSVALTGRELLASNDAIGRFLWVAIAVGLVVVLAARAITDLKLVKCLIAGVVVFGLIDLVNTAGWVAIYKESLQQQGFDAKTGLATLAGGIVYGLWFWFLEPFRTYEPRQTMGDTLRRDGHGDL